jgi:hypothetical protein
LTLSRGRVAEYKALVTDVNLKGTLNGWEVARQIREIAADFPVVYMTGAAADAWTSQGVPNSILLQTLRSGAVGDRCVATAQRNAASISKLLRRPGWTIRRHPFNRDRGRECERDASPPDDLRSLPTFVPYRCSRCFDLVGAMELERSSSEHRHQRFFSPRRFT